LDNSILHTRARIRNLAKLEKVKHTPEWRLSWNRAAENDQKLTQMRTSITTHIRTLNLCAIQENETDCGLEWYDADPLDPICQWNSDEDPPCYPTKLREILQRRGPNLRRQGASAPFKVVSIFTKTQAKGRREEIQLRKIERRL